MKILRWSIVLAAVLAVPAIASAQRYGTSLTQAQIKNGMVFSANKGLGPGQGLNTPLQMAKRRGEVFPSANSERRYLQRLGERAVYQSKVGTAVPAGYIQSDGSQVKVPLPRTRGIDTTR